MNSLYGILSPTRLYHSATNACSSVCSYATNGLNKFGEWYDNGYCALGDKMMKAEQRFDKAATSAVQTTQNACTSVARVAKQKKEQLQNSRVYLFFTKGKIGQIIVSKGKTFVKEITGERLGALGGSLLYAYLRDQAAAQEGNPMGQLAMYMLAILPAVGLAAYQVSKNNGGHVRPEAVVKTAGGIILMHSVLPFTGAAGARASQWGGQLLSSAMGGYVGLRAAGSDVPFFGKNPLESLAMTRLFVPGVVGMAMPNPTGSSAQSALELVASTALGCAPTIYRMKSEMSQNLSLVRQAETQLGKQFFAVVLNFRTDQIEQAQLRQLLELVMPALKAPLESICQDLAHVTVKGLNHFVQALSTSEAIRTAHQAFRANPTPANYQALETVLLQEIGKCSPAYAGLHALLQPKIQQAVEPHLPLIDTCLGEEMWGSSLVSETTKEYFKKMASLLLASYIPFVLVLPPADAMTPLSSAEERNLMHNGVCAAALVLKATKVADQLVPFVKQTGEMVLRLRGESSAPSALAPARVQQHEPDVSPGVSLESLALGNRAEAAVTDQLFGSAMSMIRSHLEPYFGVMTSWALNSLSETVHSLSQSAGRISVQGIAESLIHFNQALKTPAVQAAHQAFQQDPNPATLKALEESFVNAFRGQFEELARRLGYMGLYALSRSKIQQVLNGQMDKFLPNNNGAPAILTDAQKTYYRGMASLFATLCIPFVTMQAPQLSQEPITRQQEQDAMSALVNLGATVGESSPMPVLSSIIRNAAAAAGSASNEAHLDAPPAAPALPERLKTFLEVIELVASVFSVLARLMTYCFRPLRA